MNNRQRERDELERITVYSTCIDCGGEIKEYRQKKKANSGKRIRCCRCLALDFDECRIVEKPLQTVTVH